MQRVDVSVHQPAGLAGWTASPPGHRRALRRTVRCRGLGPASPSPDPLFDGTLQTDAWNGQHAARDVAEWQDAVPGENCQREAIVCGLVRFVPGRPEKGREAGRS